ncbi:MAG: alpha/beta hydrolase [Bacteroidota bacterium]
MTARIIVLGLFLVSSFFLLVNNRLTPTRAEELSPRHVTGDARVILLNGFYLWYCATGTETGKPPVIVLHDRPGSSARSYAQFFRYLENDHRVVYYDPRGSGNSEVKPALSHYTIAELVHELDAVRRTIAGAERVILIGHGFGGALAQHYAVAHPEAVDRLILLSPLPANGYRLKAVPSFFSELLDAVLKAGIPPSDPAEANVWIQNYWQKTAAEQLRDPSKACLLPEPEGSFGTSRAFITSLASETRNYHVIMRRLNVKTLIVYGGIETEYSREEHQIAIHGALKHSTLVKLEESGHWSFLEQPERVERLITRFLSDAPQAASISPDHTDPSRLQ